MSGPHYAGLIIEGFIGSDVPKACKVLGKAWRADTLLLLRLGTHTWAGPHWKGASARELVEHTQGGASDAQTLALTLGRPVWHLEFMESGFFAAFTRFDAKGQPAQTAEVDDGSDLGAFFAPLCTALSWPLEVFLGGDESGATCPPGLVDLGESWQQPVHGAVVPFPSGSPEERAFRPDPSTVPDDAPLELPLHLPAELLEEIQQRSIARDCSLSRVLIDLLRAPVPAGLGRAFTGALRTQRFVVLGSDWKRLVAEARAVGLVPSEAVGLRAGVLLRP